jgi:hypothetical protein
MPDPSGSHPGDDLDFDRAIPAAGGTGGTDGPREGAVQCANCQRPITTQYFTASGAPLCGSCRVKLEQAVAPVKHPALIAKAAVFGLGATVVGAAIYYAVMRFFNLEIGLVAILSGWMIGKSVRAGAAGRGGVILQIGAAALTYISVAMAYFPFAVQQAIGGDGAAVTATAGADTAQTRDASVAPPEVDVTPAEAGAGEISGVVAFALIAGFALALPVLVIVGSMPSGLISAAIIGFGMVQAWQLTAAPKLVFEGPFRVGAPGSPADSPAPG